MRIVCVGGGPAGLYFAILARLRSGGRDAVTVVERNGFGATQGFAVTLGEDILDGLFRTDPIGARAVRAASHVWGEQVVEIGRTAEPSAKPVHLGGRYGYSIGRARLLEVLAERATQVGVDVRFDTEVGDPATDPLTADADLVVAADGVNSAIRARHAEHFGTEIGHGANRYVWFGTSRAFEAFTFAFEPTEAGWIWLHAYPAADCVSTAIVECSPRTWTGLGLDRMDPDEAMRMLERRFAATLDGHRLIAPPGMGSSPWLRFREIRNSTWRRDNLVLLGDAAHTTHFAIGSGTVLAVADAIGLADAVYGATAARSDARSRGASRGVDAGSAEASLGTDAGSAGAPLGADAGSAGASRGADARSAGASLGADAGSAGASLDLPAALAGYDARRRAVMAPIQDMARRSMEWFEDVDARLEQDPVRFAWSLLDRRGDQGRLHYQLHRATQIAPVRRVRRQLTSARRYRRALSRGEIGRGEIGRGEVSSATPRPGAG